MTAAKHPPKFEQVTEGEWFRPTKKHLDKCCFCGAVHAMEYEMRDGELWMRVVKVLRRPRRKAAHADR
jgi:hypothetical protein